MRSLVSRRCDTSFGATVRLPWRRRPVAIKDLWSEPLLPGGVAEVAASAALTRCLPQLEITSSSMS